MREVYASSMQAVHQDIKQPVKVNGDGRFDSPGHTAMYIVYSLMDGETSRILASCLMKVSTQVECLFTVR